MGLGNMKIGARLGLGFGIVLVMAIFIGISGYWGVRSLSDTVSKGLQTDAKLSQQASQAKAYVLGLRRFEKDLYLNIGKKDKEEEYYKKWKGQKEKLLAVFIEIEKTAGRQKDQERAKSMKDHLTTYDGGFHRVLTQIQQDNIKTPQEANGAINEFKAAIHQLDQVSTDLFDESNKQMDALEGSVKKTSNQVIFILTILVGVLVALGLGIAAFISASISRPLKKVIGGLNDGADQVASAATQVSFSSQSLAEGTSEQAAGIEETSSSFEEMASMNKHTAENANQANNLMTDMTKVVYEANRTMSELTESMKEISIASEETGKIIKTIDEIAFQTNLLALNAAVEAARAGEAGAGFAVVADEVRNLAMRAAEAAKNTANLIEGTVKKIKNGSDTVTRTNEAFAKVAAGANKVGSLVGEISAASNEQTQGIEQINRAVAEMDKVIQKNAATAEESASAAEEMNTQAEHLKGFVGELSIMVGNTNGGRVTSQISASAHKEVRKIPSLSRGKSPELKTPVAKGKEIRPEQVIPLGDDDFKDF